MKKLKIISLLTLVIFYFAAGINHFVHPQGYINIIPQYLPNHGLLNIIAGTAEVAFALMLIRQKTRMVAAIGIILMLAAFLPVHIQMLIDAPLKVGKLTVTPVIAWIRLALQPALMLWAYWHRK